MGDIFLMRFEALCRLGDKHHIDINKIKSTNPLINHNLLAPAPPVLMSCAITTCFSRQFNSYSYIMFPQKNGKWKRKGGGGRDLKDRIKDAA